MTETRAIFITGAASGIGRATAELFAARGWFVGGFDVNAAGIAALGATLPGERAFTRALDVTDREAVIAALADFVAASGGRLDLLFNNAGIDAKGPFAAMAWAAVLRLVEVNLIAGMSLIHAAIPHLKATPGSLCLSTASASAILGTANLAVYSATKHGVKGLTEALAVELAADGVRAADLLPGIIDTGMLPDEMKAMFPAEGMWRLLPPGAVAEAAWAAYHGDKLHWYVPPELGGLRCRGHAGARDGARQPHRQWRDLASRGCAAPAAALPSRRSAPISPAADVALRRTAARYCSTFSSKLPRLPANARRLWRASPDPPFEGTRL